jgi:hypothetical protein
MCAGPGSPAFFKKLGDRGRKFTSVKKTGCQLNIRGADNYPCRGRQNDTFFFGPKNFLPDFFRFES